MDFIRAFNTTALEVIVFIGIIVSGTIVGKKLRDRKDEKDAASNR